MKPCQYTPRVAEFWRHHWCCKYVPAAVTVPLGVGCMQVAYREPELGHGCLAALTCACLPLFPRGVHARQSWDPIVSVAWIVSFGLFHVVCSKHMQLSVQADDGWWSTAALQRQKQLVAAALPLPQHTF